MIIKIQKGYLPYYQTLKEIAHPKKSGRNIEVYF